MATNNTTIIITRSQISALPRHHCHHGHRIFALPLALGGCYCVATAVWAVIMRGSFSEVIEVCGGLLLMGWIELVVYHGAEKPLFDASGHLKGAPGTHDPTCWSPLGSV